jgi:peptidoglycan/LPS O-acetylase OafA/YrhL
MMAAAVQYAPAAQAGSRIPELDGIRGIAILMVVALHFGVPASTGFVRDALGLGWAGVDLFFVLSGFLITGILLDSADREHYYSRFYVRRALRIFPVYYVFLLVFFHVLPLAGRFIPALGTQGAHSGEAAFWVYLSNWTPVFHQSRNMRHFWSLAIEEQFYLVWPLVVRVMRRNGLKYFSLGIIVITPGLRVACDFLGVSEFSLYRETPFRLEGLALGALIAIAVRDRELYTLLKRISPIACPAAAAALALVIARGGTSYLALSMREWGYTAIAILSAALVFRTIQTGGTLDRLASCLRLRSLAHLGKYSYGMYVWHLPLAERMRVGVERLHINRWMEVPLVLAVGIAASYAVARLSWWLIEGPCLRMKSRFAN